MRACVRGVQLTVWVELVVVVADEIDAHAHVLLVEYVPFVVLLKRGRVELHEAIWIERILD